MKPQERSGAIRSSEDVMDPNGSGGRPCPAPFQRGQDLLPQSYGEGRHLDELVVIDVGDAFFQGHLHVGGEDHRVIRARSPHVRQLLPLCGVDDEIRFARVLPDNLSLIFNKPYLEPPQP